jgi:hypothetical protein
MRQQRYAWKKELPREYRWRCGLRSSRWFKTDRAARNSAVRNGLAWWEGERFLPGPLLEMDERVRPAE